jgi:hypothetical protein
MAKLPYPLRYPGSENHQRSLWCYLFPKNLAPRCEHIYFILSFFFFQITKNTETTKSCFTQNYRLMQSHGITCANSPTLPAVQP